MFVLVQERFFVSRPVPQRRFMTHRRYCHALLWKLRFLSNNTRSRRHAAFNQTYVVQKQPLL